jgi:hypothetical protein
MASPRYAAFDLEAAHPPRKPDESSIVEVKEEARRRFAYIVKRLRRRDRRCSFVRRVVSFSAVC